MRTALLALTLTLSACATAPRPPDPVNTVNDVSQLNPIQVERVVAPATVEELAQLVASHAGPISIGGGRFSQGGQTACTGCLFIDMRRLNRILSLDETNRVITVQAGMTWREMQEHIDPKDLSPKIMQSFSNFTVGGSLSVNCHGDYSGLGPIVESVRAFRIVLADGSIRTASRTENRDLFDAAIGGYGGIGVIVEATLDLAQNTRLERVTHRMTVADYPAWRAANIEGNPNVILHHGVIYPGAYTSVVAEVSTLTDKPVTIPDRLAPLGTPTPFQRFLLNFVTFMPFGQFLHENVYDPLTSARSEVVWRNYEAAQDVYSLEPASRARSTYSLQEYFVPLDRFDEFVPEMARILNARRANVLNVAIRHSRADRETLLSWARQDVYAFVLYYEQGTSPEAQAEVGVWTRELVDAALAQDGTFYLPYQVHATREQFLRAYPRAAEYFETKRRVDPIYKFRNRLWEAYYR
jgi:FAD/FMN-containing dehydrogenase